MYTGDQTPKPWIPGSLPIRPAFQDAAETGGGGDEGVAEVEARDGDEDTADEEAGGGDVLESPPGEESGGLGPSEEVVETDQVAQWWPPLVACPSPRPRRNIRVPARYRD